MARDAFSSNADAAWDLIVIGGGPAGLAAAIVGGRSRLRTLVLDKIGVGGGQLFNTEFIEDYPGVERIRGESLAENLDAQARLFGAKFELGEAIRLEALSDGYRITTAENQSYSAAAIVVATGGAPRRLGVPGEIEHAGRGVAYCAVCDGAFFEGRDVAVVGGGDSAVEEAIFLTRYARRVYLIHRRGELKAARTLQEKAFAHPAIITVLHTEVVAVNGEEAVEALRLRDVRDGTERDLNVTGLFVYVGFEPKGDFLADFVDRDAQGFVITDERMATRSPGLFVAGDLRHQFIRQVATAVGDATTAAVAAARYLDRRLVAA